MSSHISRFSRSAATAIVSLLADGFHPSEEGHRRAAVEFLRDLGGRFRPPRESTA